MQTGGQGFFFFLKKHQKKPSSSFGRHASNGSPTHRHSTSCRRPRWITVYLSEWVCFFGNWHQCTANSSPTEITSIQHSDRKRTIVEKKRNDKDKSFKMWVSRCILSLAAALVNLVKAHVLFFHCQIKVALM